MRPERPDQEGSAALQAHPEDVTGDKCGLCQKGDEQAHDWVCCDACGSWVHFSCDARPGLGSFKVRFHVTSCMQAHFETPKHLTSCIQTLLQHPESRALRRLRLLGALLLRWAPWPGILQSAASSP